MEDLETGWGPATPTGDTYVRRYTVEFADWLEAAAGRAGRRVVRTADWVAADAGSPEPLMNAAILLRPVTDEREAARRAAELSAFLGEGPGGPAALFHPGAAPAMPGWHPMGHPPLMLRPPGGTPPAPPDGLRIVEVHDGAGLADFERIVVDGFGFRPLQPWRPGVAFDPSFLDVPDTHVFVGYAGGRAVSTATAHVGAGIVHVEWVATLAEARGRGYGAAVTWAATTVDPSLPAMLIASDDGRPVYERMGYLALCRFTAWSGGRGASTAG